MRPGAAAGTALEMFIVDTESSRWKHRGAKERRIAQWMRRNYPLGRGLREVSVYYQHLNALLDEPGFVAAHPQLVARLRSHRDG